jgi:osmotically-inducible protein OsmY
VTRSIRPQCHDGGRRAIVDKTAATAGKAATTLERAVDAGTLTAKIKSKMALDDLVKARTINVDTTGSVVTLTGTVESNQERERAVRLARETAGVTSVVDKLLMKPR